MLKTGKGNNRVILAYSVGRQINPYVQNVMGNNRIILGLSYSLETEKKYKEEKKISLYKA